MSRPTQPPLVGQLRDQHDVIEQVVGSLYHWALAGQDADAAARQVFVAFFHIWVHGLHHGLEEKLFSVLIDKVEIPSDRGPLLILRQEHKAALEAMNRVEHCAPGEEVAAAAVELAHIVWTHIDKENSVMLPEAGERLVRSGLNDLAGRVATADEDRIRDEALVLVEQWPPRDDDDLYRGDGCMACAAYGETCGGIEKEWWNAWEWDYHNSFQG